MSLRQGRGARSVDFLAEDVQDSEEVFRHVVAVCVSVGEGDCDDVDLGRAHGMEDGEGVVDARVTVDDAAARFRHCVLRWRVFWWSVGKKYKG